MANSASRNAAPYPLPVPSPRSPPKYPDVCGRHRKQAELQVLNREIGFLEEELQSLDTLHPASKCCKEIHEFMGKNPDPLIHLDLKVHRSSRFWKWLCSKAVRVAVPAVAATAITTAWRNVPSDHVAISQNSPVRNVVHAVVTGLILLVERLLVFSQNVRENIVV
ncbi:hypothetical protein H6P81_002615 [Aristolochia fimbriata]|uniref:G protein gamma domain-containing protein n=1 Tax=Aristolochia fimbriata TaxID=158543 RepID=A0AAV7FA89_ARIFI|nr:hypothetical protein H6P81_002615 [Aristolochia fimbriata]